MNSKKAITLLLISTMLLSLTPILTANAVAIEDIWSENGIAITWNVVYDDLIIVTGTGGTPGRNVNVYWDAIDDWNGESGLLNSSKAEGNGDWEIWFNVPAAVNGEHYISVENVRTNEVETYVTALFVDAYIEVDPSTGLDGDEVTISGYGFDSEVDIVDVEFDGDDIDTSPSTPETDELGSWTATFEVPDIGYGVYTVYAEDDEGYWNVTEFEIGPAISLSSPPVGVARMKKRAKTGKEVMLKKGAGGAGIRRCF
jgi:hypothetical protein